MINQSERIALFAGSFDPFTLGHASVVEATLRIFDRVVIGVGCNISKRGMLSVEQRVALIEDLYRGDQRISVQSYDGLTASFALEVGAVALVRGVRNTLDFESERSVEAVNRELCPQLQTVMISTPAELSHISSSVVRELYSFGASVEKMMPVGVELDRYM